MIVYIYTPQTDCVALCQHLRHVSVSVASVGHGVDERGPILVHGVELPPLILLPVIILAVGFDFAFHNDCPRRKTAVLGS